MIFYTQIKTDMGQEVPARTGLGSTTVLAVVTIGFGFVGTTKGKEKAVLHKGVHMYIICDIQRYYFLFCSPSVVKKCFN